MNQEIVKRAGEVIASKANYVGGGMEGHCVLALTDEHGYPTASTLTIAKADGINWLTFCTSTDSTKAMRIQNCNRAGVCIASSEYNITLVGTIEILTDINTKKDMWFEPMKEMWSSPDDPSFCVLRFNTERYNLYFADDETAATGVLEGVKQGTMLKVTPGLAFKGQCNQALDLYKRAFGATVLTKLLYSDANPKDMQYKSEEKDFVYYGEIVIGDRLITIGDDSGGVLNEKIGGISSATSLLVEFANVDELNAAYGLISDGATILTPMCNTSYCTGYVSLVDKFGIHWDLMSGYTG
ncbi:MAG: pyridoxamine 5'-phosphate oxidase family protein [Defluviitaleaceae bacterium]|nr:pyridoxamine 5'-phosphate oxidase family protein [Defluviitaleaceae bacterium]